MKRRKIILEVSETVHGLLATLCDEFHPDVESVVLTLIDHAQQGVYRPGAWERDWLSQAFGPEFTLRLVPGCPYGREGCESIFVKPAPPLKKKGANP